MNKINKKTKMVWIQINGNSQSMACMEPDIGYWESFNKTNEIIDFAKEHVFSFCLTKGIDDIEDEINYETSLVEAKKYFTSKSELRAIEKLDSIIKKMESKNYSISSMNEMFHQISKQFLKLDVEVEICCFNSVLEASWLAKAHGAEFEPENMTIEEWFESDTLI